jgi:hypothetical protein
MVARQTSKPPRRLGAGGFQVRDGWPRYGDTRRPRHRRQRPRFLPDRHPMTLLRTWGPRSTRIELPGSQASVTSRSKTGLAALIWRRSVTPCRYDRNPSLMPVSGGGLRQMCTPCTLTPLRRGGRPSARSTRARIRPAERPKPPDRARQRLETAPKVHLKHRCQDPGAGDSGPGRGRSRSWRGRSQSWRSGPGTPGVGGGRPANVETARAATLGRLQGTCQAWRPIRPWRLPRRPSDALPRRGRAAARRPCRRTHPMPREGRAT